MNPTPPVGFFLHATRPARAGKRRAESLRKPAPAKGSSAASRAARHRVSRKTEKTSPGGRCKATSARHPLAFCFETTSAACTPRDYRPRPPRSVKPQPPNTFRMRRSQAFFVRTLLRRGRGARTCALRAKTASAFTYTTMHDVSRRSSRKQDGPDSAQAGPRHPARRKRRAAWAPSSHQSGVPRRPAGAPLPAITKTR